MNFSNNFPNLNFIKMSILDVLKFAAIISTTDAVVVWLLFMKIIEPKLFSILFGEGIINNAVYIVI